MGRMKTANAITGKHHIQWRTSHLAVYIDPMLWTMLHISADYLAFPQQENYFLMTRIYYNSVTAAKLLILSEICKLWQILGELLSR